MCLYLTRNFSYANYLFFCGNVTLKINLFVLLGCEFLMLFHIEFLQISETAPLQLIGRSFSQLVG